MRILVTRPLQEADRTASALARLGHEPVLAPMLTIVPLDDPLPAGPWSGVIMTSGNAARAIASRAVMLLPLPVFAVGHQTAIAARDAGFVSVVSAAGDGADLVALLATQKLSSTNPLLYLAGNDRARDLTAELSAYSIRAETHVVYRAVPAKALAATVKEAFLENRLDGVLHYSRRTAAIFCECAASSGVLAEALLSTHYCLSARAAEPLVELGAKDVRVGSSPDEDALFRLLSPA